MSESVVFPWGQSDPDSNIVYHLPIEWVQIPEPRVTSTFTPQQQEEFLASLKTEGQKLPIELILVDGKLWLSDGLNRILGLRTIGVKVVKSIVKKGTASDVQIANIITARHRGKENPAQTAEVIRDLIDVEHVPKEVVMSRLGLSSSWFNKLYQIAQLPPEVKDHIKYGRLSVAAAFHLKQVEDTTKILELATRAVTWGYTEQQMKDAVIEMINPDYDQTQRSYVFGADGSAKPIYPKCILCQIDLIGKASFVWICEQDLEIVKEFIAHYNKEPAPISS